jgi:cellulose synthase/poly-beta-1,6-N-acetylglucosamine synthase-like glycosyltransferase
VEKYIERCIESVVKQNYPGKINILVVNDASTDRTLEIVNRLIKKYGSSKRKIFVINRKKSQGRKAPVLNEGIRFVLKNMRTPFIAPLDADTFITENVLRSVMGVFNTDERTAAVTCPLIPQQKNFLLRLQYVEYVMSNFFRDLLGRMNALCATPAFTVFRAGFFKEAGVYNETSWTEDFDMALKVKSRFYNIGYIKEKAYFIAPESLGKLRTERVRWAHGTVQALCKDYTYMLSPKYGAVGTFFLPITVVLGLFIMMLALFLIVYGLIYWGVNSFHNLLVGWPPRLDFELNFFDISVFLSEPKLILGAFGILISILFFIFAKNYGKEKINLLDYLVFYIPYIWFLAYTQVEGSIKYIFKLKMSWGEMHNPAR